MMSETFQSDLHKGFCTQERQRLKKFNLYPPSQILKESIENEIDISDYDKQIGEKLIELGRQKGP